MRTAAICPTCATYENAVCVLYNGELLNNIDVSPLDSLEVALQSINSTVGTIITLINNVSANPITLTTEGSSGPAELTGTALNIPDYTITLTTNGNSGPATFVNNDLNIPEYEFSLQDVLDINNTATTSIEIEDNFIEARDGAVDNVAGLDGVNGNFYLKTGGGQLTSISATNVTGSAKALELPNVNGTLVASVNGSTADAAGNVSLTFSAITTTKVSLTSTQIKSLHTTPVQILPAPGAGKLLNVIKVAYRYNWVGGDYNSVGITLSYDAFGGTPITNTLFGLLNSSSSSIGFPSFLAMDSGGLTNISISIETNADAGASGFGSLDVYITYETITL